MYNCQLGYLWAILHTKKV